jgi:glutathione synthase/RimK-type ligase-like ATP-grasp enzyme
MVLLYGIPGDGPFELVADALEEAGTDFVIINPRHFNEIDFVLHIHDGIIEGEISIGAKSYSLNSITGVYNRAIEFSMLPEAQLLDKNSIMYKRYAKMFEVFNQWIEIASCRVVNKASAMSSNGSKPYQQLLIQPFFAVPETEITNSPKVVGEFRQQHGEIIYKSASSVRSVVQTITNNDAQNFQNIRYCPTLFQQRLRGCNYRVHVIGKKVFAVKAETETVDYRYSNREAKETILSDVDLPADVAQKCISLAQDLQLSFAGIDLFLTDDGQWYCFEVNPSPGFSYFEINTGQPIAKTLGEYLSGS